MGVRRVYILFLFLCRIKNPPSPLPLPPHCKLDVRRGKTDADPALTPKEKGKDLSRQTRIASGDGREPRSAHGGVQARLYVLRSMPTGVISIHSSSL